MQCLDSILEIANKKFPNLFVYIEIGISSHLFKSMVSVLSSLSTNQLRLCGCFMKLQLLIRIRLKYEIMAHVPIDVIERTKESN